MDLLSVSRWLLDLDTAQVEINIEGSERLCDGVVEISNDSRNLCHVVSSPLARREQTAVNEGMAALRVDGKIECG